MSRVLYTRNFKLLAFAIVSLALVLGVAISQLFETRHFIDELSDSNTRTLAFRRTRSWLLDAEAGQRGFVVTGDRSYLAGYNAAMQVLPEHLAQLAVLCADDSQQLRRAKRLRLVSESKMEEMRQSVTVMERDGFEAAQALARSNVGKAIMNEARQIVEDALRREDQVQTAMKRRQIRGVWVTTSLILVCGLLCLAAGANVFVLFQKAIKASLVQRRLLIQRRRAITADREKSRFMANMSHEIRTPMNAILGFSQLLRDEVRTDRAKHYVNAIGSAGENLLGLINDVLDLSKIEAGRVELRPEVIDLREVVGNVRTLMSQRAIEKGLTLRAEIAEDCPPWLLMDALRLRQMLLNLLSNAVKFTSSGAVILRVTSRPGSVAGTLTLEIRISDTGRGIPPGELDAIFKPFRQGSRQDENSEQGTGLGLSITRRLAQMMGGSIEAESTVGKGSVFTLILPDVEIPAADPAPAEEPLISGDLNLLPAMKVLIVDDNAYNREVLGGFFRNTHHTVIYGTNGLEAVELAVRENPDLILMDIRMPRLDGREATAAIRRNHNLARTPVIAVTASSLSGSAGEIRGAFNGYLRKPFLRHQLTALLHEVMAPAAAAENPGEEAGNTGEMNGMAGAGTPGKAAPLPETAAATLRDLLESRWPGIRKTMAVRAVGGFANELAALAEAWNCGPLRVFAVDLQAETSAYHISGMERTLARFPALVDALAPAPADSQ
ncbi:MAG: ATP-binding protein [Verrucomicrobiota bacterium]